ncbi:hypothetical protein Ahy_Scaffold9g108570 isoform C [Arachis hypogaea]|uniref:Uncharacterized protein n=1 Tax=Arachis hypogaea TaxID=3818 RepID=A0A444WNI8_ARAHY|nr:hypothetical protein Ahy_Scaffold9g108570 isoform C [Arachis hypogaea]
MQKPSSSSSVPLYGLSLDASADTPSGFAEPNVDPCTQQIQLSATISEVQNYSNKIETERKGELVGTHQIGCAKDDDGEARSKKTNEDQPTRTCCRRRGAQGRRASECETVTRQRATTTGPGTCCCCRGDDNRGEGTLVGCETVTVRKLVPFGSAAGEASAGRRRLRLRL